MAAALTTDHPRVGEVLRIHFERPDGTARHLDAQVIRASDDRLELRGNGERVWSVPRGPGEDTMRVRPSDSAATSREAGTVRRIKPVEVPDE